MPSLRSESEDCLIRREKDLLNVTTDDAQGKRFCHFCRFVHVKFTESFISVDGRWFYSGRDFGETMPLLMLELLLYQDQHIIWSVSNKSY